MQIHSVSDFRRAVRIGPYAWPGGYAVLFLTDDGGQICHKCAEKERRLIADSIGSKSNDGWRVVGAFTLADCDGGEFCDNCSAYFPNEE
jgi:hypothetical protein